MFARFQVAENLKIKNKLLSLMPLSVCLDAILGLYSCVYVSFLWVQCTLFTGPTTTEFGKINFKIGSHDTIHTFKNYFTTMFSVFNFQFSVISNIQTNSYITQTSNKASQLLINKIKLILLE